MPFHMVTFFGDVFTKEVSLMLSRLSDLDGEMKIMRLSPTAAVLTSSLTYRADMRGHLTMGDLVALEHSGVWYYLLSTLTEDALVTQSLIDDVPLNNGTVVLLLRWNDNQFETVQNMKQNWNDLSPLKLDTRNCVVGCGVDSQILCFSSGTSSIGNSSTEYLAPVQYLSGLGECFKASSVEIEEDGSVEDLLIIASNYNSDSGLITVLSYQDSGNFTEVQTIPCYYCSFADLGRFEDEVFIVLMSESTNFIYIGIYDQDKNKFVLFQNLNLANPREAYFYNRDGSLLLSVLAKASDRKEIFTFNYQGSMSFVREPEKTLNLLGIESHNILNHPKMVSPLISSMGVPAPGRTLSANSLLQPTYKQTDTALVREELSANPAPRSLSISGQCKDMALNYAEKLYNTSGGPEDPMSFAKMALRLLPRPFLNLDIDSFRPSIQDVYENAENSLMISNMAEAYIIFYAYNNFPNNLDRDIDSNAFRGTGLVFQDKDGVLFMRFRIKDSPYSGGDAYRGFSILESCNSNTTMNFSTFSSGEQGPYSPIESPVEGEGEGEVQEICLMVHDFPLVVENNLKNLSGSGHAGAVSVQDSEGNTFACGYMNHPLQSMRTLNKEHGDFVNDQRLVLVN